MVAAVLSGNRNFEGRVNHDVRANYLASPPLVVAYALAGSITIDLATEPLGTDADGEPVYLRDIWPSAKEIAKTVRKAVKRDDVPGALRRRVRGDPEWRKIEVKGGLHLWLGRELDLCAEPALFRRHVADAVAGDRRRGRAHPRRCSSISITTDHISPAGAIKKDSPAGQYLIEHGVASHDFNSYGSRRGNHEVMMRGTFANTRIKNQMVHGRRRRRHACTTRPASRCRSTTPRCAIRPRACRSSSSPARNTAPARRATGRPRARGCSACAR